jgi:transposase
MAQRTRGTQWTITHPNAAGIDVGSSSHYVSVPPERDEQAVREFGCHTSDLKALAAWLVACGVDTVALESTGVYWVALYEVLESHGLEVWLVNAKSVRSQRAQVRRTRLPVAAAAARRRAAQMGFELVAASSALAV